MWKNKKVSVIFPAYNEEKNIKRAVEEFFATRVVDEIIIVNNNSKDHTVEEARKTKAKVVTEKKQGYGNALIRGYAEATGDFIISSEPDGTFDGKDVLKLLAYSDDFDVVFGTRTNKSMIQRGAKMGRFLRIGNIFIAKLIGYLFNGPSLTDVGCTMKLIKKDVLRKIQKRFSVGKSHFSPEFMILALKKDLKCIEIPLNYKKRIGESKITSSFWKSFKLGWIMIGMVFAYRLGLK